MAYKVHQSPDGIWRKCVAQKGKCRYGPEKDHKTFASREAFEEWTQKELKKEFGVIKKSPRPQRGYSRRTQDTRGNKRVITRVITDPNEIKRYKEAHNLSRHSSNTSVVNRLKCVDPNAKELIYCEVDKGHKNGPEIHCVRADSSVFIYNKRTAKFITVLLARRGQLDSYIRSDFRKANPEETRKMYKIALLNSKTKANQVGNKDGFMFTEAGLNYYNREKRKILNR